MATASHCHQLVQHTIGVEPACACPYRAQPLEMMPVAQCVKRMQLTLLLPWQPKCFPGLQSCDWNAQGSTPGCFALVAQMLSVGSARSRHEAGGASRPLASASQDPPFHSSPQALLCFANCNIAKALGLELHHRTVPRCCVPRSCCRNAFPCWHHQFVDLNSDLCFPSDAAEQQARSFCELVQVRLRALHTEVPFGEVWHW
mmetsp:Transcript_32791/g.59955  ORF Transcript_32791/g.59955 Transcript_32791/m.59955 type:complete len:201 (-) Transcript_32791:1254-1856(-)